MSWPVILTQIALPTVLLAWLAIYPAAGWLARVLQLLSIATILLGVALAALWTMPPYWMPHIYGLAFLVIVISQFVRGRHPGPKLWSTSVSNSVLILIVAALGLQGANLSWQAIQGRTLPAEDVVNIAPPFTSGHYLIAHGGSTSMVNGHLKTLDPALEQFHAWRGQSKALDIFRTTPLGFHKDGWLPTDPARYTTFATPVAAPCDGEIALVVDGLEDMPVPEMDRDNLAGNYVAINCGGFFVILAHLRQGSITVENGERVRAGDPIGQMGNSGNSSEPHLHLHAQRGLPADAPLSGEPLWLTIDDRFLIRNDRFDVSTNTPMGR